MFHRALTALTFLAVVSLAFLAPSVHAQARLTPGKDYMELPRPLATDSGNKIEVIEFFWYRCPHCYNLEPSLEAWVKKLPADTEFRRVPAIFNEEWSIDARIFFGLEALGQVERVHRGLFDAIHKQGGAALRGKDYFDWVVAYLEKQGVDKAKFEAATKSFSVEAKMKRAAQMAGTYQLDGVPTLAVQGRYTVSASLPSIGKPQQMLANTDYLIEQVRRTGLAKK
jgi:thiol:disulfide interchange protein DsbA